MLNSLHKKSSSKIYDLSIQFVADPNKYIATHTHTTGGAVDVTLLNQENNQYLDFGCLHNEPNDLSWTFNFAKLSDEQKNNRSLLFNAMIGAGFANLASEWWHYSYGDQICAMSYDKSKAIYGSIDFKRLATKC